MSIPIKATRGGFTEGTVADVAAAICLLTGKRRERREVLRRLRTLKDAYPSAYARVVSQVAWHCRDGRRPLRAA